MVGIPFPRASLRSVRQSETVAPFSIGIAEAQMQGDKSRTQRCRSRLPYLVLPIFGPTDSGSLSTNGPGWSSDVAHDRLGQSKVPLGINLRDASVGVPKNCFGSIQTFVFVSDLSRRRVTKLIG